MTSLGFPSVSLSSGPEIREGRRVVARGVVTRLLALAEASTWLEARPVDPNAGRLDSRIPVWLYRSEFQVRFYATDAGRSQPIEFLDALPARDRAQVVADVMALRDHGLQAPISMKPIKGRSNRGMFEIRTGGFRTLFCQRGGVIWILHVCKKQDQDAGIEAARARMKRL